MQVKIQVTKKDLNTSTYTILCNGLGTWRNSTLTYSEDDGTAMSVAIIGNELECHRKGELELFYRHINKETTSMYIDSEFGDLIIKIYTHSCEIKNNSIVVDYEIVNGSTENDRFLISWDWQELKDE